MKKVSLNWDEIDQLSHELIKGQEAALFTCAKRIIPTITPEDLLQPNDYVELENHPHFRYEEGLLAGLKTFQAAFFALKQDFKTD